MSALLLFLLFAMAEKDKADLTFAPPVTTIAIPPCGYASKNCANKRRYHAGLDYRRGDGPVSVHATNHGRVAYVEKMGWDDQGMGTNIILEHRLESGRRIFSSYSHLASIEPGLKRGDLVAKGQKIGIMGGSGYGQSDYWGVHLHFELKDKAVPYNSSGYGTYWGYTPDHPDEYGYHDPNAYFGKVKVKAGTWK